MSAQVFYGIRLKSEFKDSFEFDELAEKHGLESGFYNADPGAVRLVNIWRCNFEESIGSFIAVNASAAQDDYDNEEPVRFRPPADTSAWDEILRSAAETIQLETEGEPGWFIAENC